MIPITCVFPEWGELPLGVQAWRNLRALVDWRYTMRLSAGWEDARIEATVRNRERVYLYERARRKRIQVYQDKAAKRAARGVPYVARYAFVDTKSGRETPTSPRLN